jgi:hypothetical protein
LTASPSQKSTIVKTAELLAQVFPKSDISQPEYLVWLYQESPFGQVIEANLDDEQGRAGHYALVPCLLTRDGFDRNGALSLNTAVHRRARGGGAFVGLAADAISEAERLGGEFVLGVANANSTPGFVRRLGFDLLTSLPARIMLATPGAREGLRSAWADADVFAPGALADAIEPLLRPPSVGEARRWTPETLAWRLGRPGAHYALHRGEDLLAVTAEDRRHGIRVAVLLKVFACAPLAARRRRALVRAICRFHRTPLALHVGLNDLIDFRGLTLPKRLRESPLNLIYRSLDDPKRPVSIVDFEFLDFDAY